ncbi:hypothetical protein [Chitinophaga deserti]|uniref:hypothetical protein n=1 Tax=Chitinophaga deserti TaxID=2164099 RepID=UPI000D6A9121|nr:hypothetical protein [Chitinophaga deserti]
MIHEQYTIIRNLIWENKITTYQELYLAVPLHELSRDTHISESQLREWFTDIGSVSVEDVKQLSELLEIPEYRMMRIIVATQRLQNAQLN